MVVKVNEKLNRLMPESEGPVLCYEITKPISLEGYELFLKLVRDILERYGEVRVLMYYSDYQGWEKGAAEMDFASHIEFGPKLVKLAIVNAPEKEIMARIIRKPLTGAELRFFSEEGLQEALAWIKA